MEGPMYRYQMHVHVRFGPWGAFQRQFEELTSAMTALELAPFHLWESTFGRANNAHVVADYPTMADFEREYRGLHGDPGCMSIWRSMGEHLESSPSIELWWRPSEPSRGGDQG